MGLAVVLAVTSAAVGSVVVAESAAAAVPSFPDNIVVFPNRDFVSIDGYDVHAGETATITVTRAGQVVGQAEGVLTGGSPSIEVNHPGGVCWGTGAGSPDVTPDILPGDVVSVSVGGEVLGETTTSSAAVTSVDYNGDKTLVVSGHVGADVIPAQLEQRIIAPDLTGTEVAKRDVRAVPGPAVPAPRGGYVSGLEYSPDGQSFTATYEFDVAGSAAIAAAGGARAMSWQVEDLDANRQGLTIAEFGELGGPGFGGCPNGPLQSGPPAPNNITVTRTSSGSGSSNINFTWTPAVAVPGTPAITGYRVVAIDTEVTAGSEQVELGKRIGNPTATGTTIAVDSAKEYTFEVRSVNAVGNETIPPATPVIAPPDTTGPTVDFSPAATDFFAPASIELSSEAGAQIFYALTDIGDPAPELLTAGELSGFPVDLYTGPIDIATTKRLSVVAFDTAGNASLQVDRVITITAAATPTVPAVTATGGEGQALLQWPASTVDVGAPPVVDYLVEYTGAATGSRTVPAAAGTVTTTVTGLGAGSYTFTVKARSAAGSSLPSDPVTVDVTEALQVNAGTDKTATRGGPAVALTGSSPNSGVTYLWQRVDSESVGAAPVVGPSFLSATNVASPTVTLPTVALPTAAITPAATFEARNAPLFYRLTVSKPGATSVSDVVKVSVGTDTVSIATGRYRAGSELRLNGSVTNAGATVRIYSKADGATSYTFVGTATLTAAPGGATWELRLRNGAVPAQNRPWYAFSTFGGGAGPFAT